LDEKAIRDRFLECVNHAAEINGSSVSEIAVNIGSSRAYFSQLKSKENPEVRASLIADFCLTYGYSATYIITGEGSRYSKEERLIEIIGELFAAMLELKPKNPSAIAELIDEVKKRIQ
jgi:transcriptional regulator with XRE-family HTH domain